MLIEDYPGVGKTALARALARSIDCQFARVQCTSDLLPADVVGTNVYDQREQRFEFRPGPVFANVVLVDEINRASPKTQSGLLECMQERRVTVDVHTHELARPFIVLATQNPIEYEGTYPLPEAQVDRFMVRISLGYPSRGAEAGMLADHESGDRVLTLAPVATAAEVLAAQDAAKRVRASEPLRDYIVRLLWRTREDPRVDLGASPRAGLLLLRAAKAYAMMQGRDHALPDDVQALAQPVLSHRLVLAPGVAAQGRGRRGHRRRRLGESVVTRPPDRRIPTHPRSAGGEARGGGRDRRAALILVALLFDAAPLFVPGVALVLLARGRRPRGSSWPPARRRIERHLESERVVEDEPIEATIEVTPRSTGACRAPRSSTRSRASRCRSARPMSLISGGRTASVRIVARFPRRGVRRIDPPTLVVSRRARARPRGPRQPVARPGAARAAAHRARQVGPGGGGEVAPRRRCRRDRAAGRDRGRRPAALPPGHAGVADPLAGAGARSRAARAPAARRHRHAARSWWSTRAAAGPPEHLDAAVRAAASLVLELARASAAGCCCPASTARSRSSPT